jgi:hypothetical protein
LSAINSVKLIDLLNKLDMFSRYSVSDKSSPLDSEVHNEISLQTTSY